MGIKTYAQAAANWAVSMSKEMIKRRNIYTESFVYVIENEIRTDF